MITLLANTLAIKAQAEKTEIEMTKLMKMLTNDNPIITGSGYGVERFQFSVNGAGNFAKTLTDAVDKALPSESARKAESIKLAEILEAKAAKLREGAR